MCVCVCVCVCVYEEVMWVGVTGYGMAVFLEKRVLSTPEYVKHIHQNTQETTHIYQNMSKSTKMFQNQPMKIQMIYEKFE